MELERSIVKGVNLRWHKLLESDITNTWPPARACVEPSLPMFDAALLSAIPGQGYLPRDLLHSSAAKLKNLM